MKRIQRLMIIFPFVLLLAACGKEAGQGLDDLRSSGTGTLLFIVVTQPQTNQYQFQQANTGINMSRQFTATGVYSDATKQDITAQVTWSSSNTLVATISNTSGSNGLAMALSAGTTTIEATYGTITGSTTLTVSSVSLMSIQINQNSPLISTGGTQQFNATGTFSDTTPRDITAQVIWSSSNTSVATISNTPASTSGPGYNGLATAISKGKTTITATSGNISASTFLGVGIALLPSKYNHSVVWTGTEMIVWGGTESSGPTSPTISNNGYRYNPATDSWTAISTTNAPTARQYHAAVWTGTEMIVWGGSDANGLTNTGGRYNPTTDAWTAMPTTSAPTARKDHSVVWTGTEIIAWGGSDSTGTVNTGARYNPTNDTWTPTSIINAPTPRWGGGHTMVWSGTEMIVWGGEAGGRTNTGARYNPTNNTWTATSITNVPAPRMNHGAVWTGTEMIVWGGDGGGLVGPINTGGRYNPATNAWTTTSTAGTPSARQNHSAVWTGMVMTIWGGQDLNYSNVNTGACYNPATDAWTATSISNAPASGNNYKTVWTGTEMVVWGGWDNTGGRYKPTTDTWTSTSTFLE